MTKNRPADEDTYVLRIFMRNKEHWASEPTTQEKAEALKLRMRAKIEQAGEFVDFEGALIRKADIVGLYVAKRASYI